MTEAEGQGRKLLTVVERIIADTGSLIALSEQHLARARQSGREGEDAGVDAAAREVVRHFSGRTALTGGLAAVPSLIPGVGSVVGAVGGTVADITLVLKSEVEMALVLSHLYGFDITRPAERQLAFLLASVGTYEARSGGSFLSEVAEVARATGEALWNYAPREASKLLVSVMTKLALLKLSKGLLLRALPVVGIAVGSSMNKALTERVGERCMRDLRTRRQLLEKEDAPPKKKAAAKKTDKPARKKAASARKPRQTG